MITYTLAEIKDLKNIEHILSRSKLPFSDIRESAIDFIVAKDDQEIIGCIGLERYHTEGLLRSFAVENDYRNKGIGKELYHQLLHYASQNNIKTLHLLTTTARDYFLKTGFGIASKSNAPETIRNTKEFAGLCPSTSVYMTL